MTAATVASTVADIAAALRSGDGDAAYNGCRALADALNINGRRAHAAGRYVVAGGYAHKAAAMLLGVVSEEQAA